MKHFLTLLFLTLCVSAYAQYPNAPNKIALGRQTTGDGLIFRGGDSIPYNPTTAMNAWFYFDTVEYKLFFYDSGSWRLLADTTVGGNANLSFIPGTGTITLQSSTGTDVRFTAGSNIALTAAGDSMIISSTGGGTLDGEVKGDLLNNRVDTVQRIVFNLSHSLPDSVGKLAYNSGDYTLHFGMGLGNAVYQMGQELFYPPVINKSGVDIKNGQVVMIDTSLLVQGDKMRIIPAVGTMSTSNFILGVATHDIANDAEGLVTWFGYVREVDHANIAQTGVTLDVGDILYISSTQAGRYTDVEPAAPKVNSTIALVVRKPNPNNMTLMVRPWLNEKIGDLTDVETKDAVNKSVLMYDSSTKVWNATTSPGLLLSDTSTIATKWYAADTASGVKDWVIAQGYNTGTVTSVATGYGLDGGTITTSGTLSVDTSEIATPYDVSLKQDLLSGTGLVKSTSGTISYITDNSTNWNAAYNDRITNAAFTGTDTKTLTLTQQDAGTVTASFTDLQGVTSVATGVGLSGGTITTTGTISADTSVLSTKWYAADTASGVRDWVTAQGYTSNVGTVTSIATNNGITGGTITSSGTIGLTGQALALHNLSTNGLIARTGAGTVAGRTITAGTGISVSNGDGVSGNPTITNSAPDQTVVLTAGTGINTSGTYPNFTITNSAPDQTVSITGAGINSVTGTYPNFTVTGTEVDGSVSNEGTLGVGAGSGTTAVITSNTSGATGVTISAGTGIGISETTSSNGGTITVTNNSPDQTVSITGAGINSVTGTYPNFTITATEVDGSTTNEGTLGVGAGGANTAVITSNTSGASGVTIAGGTNVTITESTSSNGGTITVNASGGDSGWFKFVNQYITPNESKPMKFSGSDSLYIFANSFSDTNYLSMSTAYLSDSISVPDKRYDLLLDIDMSLVSSVARLADSTAALRAAFPTGTVKGTGAANKVAIWASSDSLYQNTNFHWDNTNNRLGLKTSTPASLIDINASVETDRINIFADSTFVTGGYLPLNVTRNGISGDIQNLNVALNVFANFPSSRGNFVFNRGRGSSYAPSGVLLNDFIGGFAFSAISSNGTSAGGAALINAFADADATAGSTPMRISFVTGTSATNRFERLVIKSDGKIGISTNAPSIDLGIEGNSARTIGTERHTAADNAGNSLTLKVGGATSGATDKAGGDLILESGVSTGNASSNIIFETAAAGSSGTTDRSPAERMRITGSAVGILNTTPDSALTVTGGGRFSNGVLANNFKINTSGQTMEINNYYTSGSNGNNLFVGGGGTLLSGTGTSASALTGVGFLALNSNTTGAFNTANGFRALESNTIGYNNTAFGSAALEEITTGYYNTAIGDNAGRYTNATANNQTSFNSVYIGADSRAQASGNENEVVIGYASRGNGSNTVTIGNSSTTANYFTKTIRTDGTIMQTAGIGNATTATYDMSTGTNLHRAYVIFNYTVGTCTVTLPTASDWSGREIKIKTITAQAVQSHASNILPLTSNTLTTSILPAVDGAWATLVSNGTNWVIMQSGQ